MGNDLEGFSGRRIPCPRPARTSQRTPSVRGIPPAGHPSEPIGLLGREPASLLLARERSAPNHRRQPGEQSELGASMGLALLTEGGASRTVRRGKRAFAPDFCAS
jgi:hypothetical protein